MWNYYMPQRGLSALSVSTIRASEKASVRGMGKEESHVLRFIEV